MAECGQLQSLLEALASALVKDADGNVSINFELLQTDCSELSAFIDCDNNHIPPDRLLINAIGEDECGLPSLRINIPADTVSLKMSELSDVEGEITTDGSFYKWDATDGRFEERDEWDDLRITPGQFERPGISDPAYVIYYPNGGGIGTYLPEFAKDDFGCFQVQLPHGYKQGSDIYVHLHWTPGTRGNEESGALVGWKVDYSWANINGTFSDMQTADLSDACDGTDHKHQMTPEVLISGVDKHISSMLLCNVRRTDGGADDTWASAASGQLPLLLEVDFHVALDTIGSRTHSQK